MAPWADAAGQIFRHHSGHPFGCGVSTFSKTTLPLQAWTTPHAASSIWAAANHATPLVSI